MPSKINGIIRCSTRYSVFIVEMAAASPEEFPKCHTSHRTHQLKITPLDAWGKAYTLPTEVPVDPNVDLDGNPLMTRCGE